jgi:hypothetical protein
MPGKYRDRDARRLGIPALNQQSAPRTERSYSGSSQGEIAEPDLGERIPYDCGGCNHEADATFRTDPYTGRPRWFIGSFSSRCPGKADCLELVCEWLAGLGIDVTAVDLLGDPRSALYAAGGKRKQQGAESPPLPTLGQIGGWHSRFLEQQNSAALNYLLGRGISLEIVKRFKVGWDGRFLTFPMRGCFLKRREPRDGAQMMNWPGKDRPWPLYPGVSRDAGWVPLVAGELDALCALSAGLPAASVTLGAGTWCDAWTHELRGLRVVVCFDNNESELAERRVGELQAAGIRARHLDLRTLGVLTPKGDLSDYLNAGGDSSRIKPPRRGAV